ncbi:MAG: hypothetical protein K0A94_01680 [Desulfuromonadales bacterium]|nr:hypothetical protein [Desulfuromonadales bacterium]
MNTAPPPVEQTIRSDDFFISDLNDEMRVDQQCQALLKNYHQHLLKCGDYTPLEAGAMAGAGDYFLRDFVIDTLRANIFHLAASQVRGFAGNWYIHRTLEPNMKELKVILKGVAAFYHYCAANKWVKKGTSDEIAAVCADLDYFRGRIDSFHALKGDDYPKWCEECPLT